MSLRPEKHWTLARIATAILVIGFVTWALLSAAARSQTPDAPPVANAIACPSPGLTIDAHVVRVIDGDTIVCETRIRYHVRLLDCWAPESRTTDREEKQRGLASKRRLVELVELRPVRVHIPGGRTLGDVITFDRVLAHVWRVHEGTPDTVSLNRHMVLEGLATKVKKK